MRFDDDPTGFIAHCVSELISVGFDASAISIAKWAGLSLLGAILVAVVITFFVRVRKDTDILPLLSDMQFRLLLLAAVILITLPMLTRLTGDAFQVTWTSADRDFAHRICQDSLDVTAGAAQAKALTARIEQLEAAVRDLPDADVESPIRTGEETAELQTNELPLLGQAISIFFSGGQADRAERIATELQALGAGLALRESDLTESALAEEATAGDIYILYSDGLTGSAAVVQGQLLDIGVSVTDMRGPLNLRGSPLQILLF